MARENLVMAKTLYQAGEYASAVGFATRATGNLEVLAGQDLSSKDVKTLASLERSADNYYSKALDKLAQCVQ